MRDNNNFVNFSEMLVLIIYFYNVSNKFDIMTLI